MYGHPKYVVAMNEALSPELAAICVELNAQGDLPDIVELIPAGQQVIGRDGRAWLNDQPQAILDAFAADAKDLPVDWNHATELKARHGDPSPAAGWINKLEVRDGGAIWGHVTWTDAGRNSLQAREYRYLSPTFLFERETSRITRMRSVGLVNNPNLPLPALNHQESQDMKLSKAICAALSLQDDATEEQAVSAIKQLRADVETARNSQQTPSLDLYVPRADHDAQVLRATNAEQKVKDNEVEAMNTAIESEIAAALNAGKITPASVEFYKANCAQEGGLERFREFAKGAPQIVPDTELDLKKPEGDVTALNAEAQEVADQFGNSAEDIKKYGQA